MAELLNNEYFVWGIMSVLILCFSQLLKLPIKALTKKIKNEKARQMVNVTIMLIPLALGILFDYLYCTYWLHTLFSVIEGLKVGGTAVTLYAGIEKFLKGGNSKETTATLELVEDITKDGKVTNEDKSAVKEFFDKVK